MDSRKPLTAGARERLTIATMDVICGGHGSVTVPVVDMQDVLNSLSALLTPPPDAVVRGAVERITFGVAQDFVPLKADLEVLLRAVQAQRLTPEQVEAVQFADAGLNLAKCNCCAPGFICSRCAAQNALRVTFPEAFAWGLTTWTCGICGEKRPGSVNPVQDEECGDACPEHYEAGEVGRG